MVTNEKIITIDRPVEEVFAYVSDLQNAPKWQNGLLEVRRITESPDGIDTQFTGIRNFMGRKVESVLQFTAYELNKKFAFKSISGSSPFEETTLFEPTAEGTRLTTLLKLETSGLMGLAKPLIVSSLKREMDANFSILKGLLESPIVSTSS